MSDFAIGEYWDWRYRKTKRGSGEGSRGAAAAAKAAFVNDLIREKQVETVIDWGCGDGEVARQFEVAEYIGLDISTAAVEICSRRITGPGRTFLHFDGFTPPDLPPAQLALSLDVIFHQVDDDSYRRHLELVFGSAPLVCIHSSNHDEQTGVAHFLSRAFVRDIPAAWRCLREGPEGAPGFWVFEKEESS